MMKKFLYFLTIPFLFLLSEKQAFGQTIDIMPMGGYQFPAGVDVTYDDGSSIRSGRMRIQGNGNYGLGIHIGLPFQEMIISASYTTMTSLITFQPFSRPKEELFDAAQDYWMFGILRKVEMDQLEPYGGLLLGWTKIRPDEPGANNASKFSVGIEGGIKYFLAESVGIMIHGRLLVPVQWFGAGLSFGGGGIGTGLTTGSSIIQGDIGGGLVLRVGR